MYISLNININIYIYLYRYYIYNFLIVILPSNYNKLKFFHDNSLRSHNS